MRRKHTKIPHKRRQLCLEVLEQRMLLAVDGLQIDLSGAGNIDLFNPAGSGTTGGLLDGYIGQSVGYTINTNNEPGPGNLLPEAVDDTPAIGANHPPVIQCDCGGVTVYEGGTATATGTHHDPDAGESLELTASVGGVTDHGDGTWTWSFHTSDGSEESQVVEITVTDTADATATVQFQLTVDNVAPTIALTGNATVDEGSPYNVTLGAVTDPGADTVQQYVVDWGDGSSDTFDTGGVKTHTYPDGDTAPTISVDLIDEDGTHANAGSLALAVGNVAPTIALTGDATVDEGSPYSVTLGAVTDPGADTVQQYMVDWGDGSSDTFDTGGVKTHTYPDGDTAPTISVDLIDEDGTHANAGSLALAVGNVAPTIALTGDATVDEGSPYSVTLGAVTDPGADTVQQYMVDWGDGSSDTFDTGGAKTHTYPDGDTAPTISVDLVDEDGTHANAGSLAVAVNNVAPTIALTGDATVDEGSPYSVTLGAVTDPGADTVQQYVVDWGDGSSDTFDTGGVKTHTYADGDTAPTITVDLVDEDGTHANAGSLALAVGNVAPTIALTGDATIDEGSPYSVTLGAVTDPGADTVQQYMVDWGDGSSDTFDTGGVKTHTYADGDTAPTISVDLVDEDGTHANAGSLAVAVNNVAPTIALTGDATVDEGSPYSVTLGAVTDPGADTVQQYMVDWGDGSSDTFDTGGVKTHTYADGDTAPTISVDLVDEDGTHANAGSLAVAVNNVAPTIVLTGDATVDEGSPYSVALGAVTDPGADTVQQYVLDWGDGSSDTFDTGGVKTHTYADGDTAPTITVDLIDEDGTHASAGSLAVAVNNVSPVIALSGADAVAEGVRYELQLGAVTDPGVDTVTQYVVDWDDGTSNTFSALPTVIRHTYADGESDRTIMVSLQDEDGTHVGGTKVVNVVNVIPTITLVGDSSVNEGSPYSLTLDEVEDPGSDTVQQLVVNWGDGTSDTYTTLGVKTHSYADGAATHTITVDVVDEDGSHLAAGNQSVEVTNVAPTISLSGADHIEEGTRYELTLGDVADPGLDTVSQYVVDWDDGTSNTFSSLPSLLRHTFGGSGAVERTITVALKDEDGSHVGGSKSVTVAAAENLVSAVGQGPGGPAVINEQLGNAGKTTSRFHSPSPYPLPEGRGDNGDVIFPAFLKTIRDEAIRRWVDTGEVTKDEIETLDATEIEIGDLPNNVLGATAANVITIDVDAAGHGWYIDATPDNDSEYNTSVTETERRATTGAIANRMDLLTAVMHEIGHVLNHRHANLDQNHLMADSLPLGTRRLPIAEDHGITEDLLSELANDVAGAW